MIGMKKLLLICLFVLPAVITILKPGQLVVNGEEDEVEEEGTVEDEDVDGGSPADGTEDEDNLSPKNVSPDADTTLLFTKPTVSLSSVELPAGKIVEFLVGFSNNGDSDFIIDTLDASFRYPMDFSFHIQNFSAIAYQKIVKPKEEATVAYSFIPADAFAGRPIGLTINLAYRDVEGNFFFDPVFNETVQIVEFDEGFDSEVFFMYLFLVAGVILVVFLIFNFIGSKASKKKSPAINKQAIETGTANDDVDYEWIPKQATLRTPGSSKTSPRQRKNKKSANAGSDSD